MDPYVLEAIQIAAERSASSIEEAAQLIAAERTRPCVLFAAQPHWDPELSMWVAMVTAWPSQSAIAETSVTGAGKTPEEAMRSFDEMYQRGFKARE